jgi:hypothetical protein
MSLRFAELLDAGDRRAFVNVHKIAHIGEIDQKRTALNFEGGTSLNGKATYDDLKAMLEAMVQQHGRGPVAP